MAGSGPRPYTASLAGQPGQRRKRDPPLFLKELIMLKLNRSIGILLALNLAAAALRQIDVSASTKWINVVNGETVRFNVDGQSFVWNFGTLRGETSFDLSAIAPKNLQVPMVRVYVASNPLYHG